MRHFREKITAKEIVSQQYNLQGAQPRVMSIHTAHKCCMCDQFSVHKLPKGRAGHHHVCFLSGDLMAKKSNSSAFATQKEKSCESGWKPRCPAHKRAELENIYHQLSSNSGHGVESLPRGKRSMVLGICFRMMSWCFSSPFSCKLDSC